MGNLDKMNSEFNIPCDSAAAQRDGNNANRMNNVPVKELNSKEMPAYRSRADDNIRMRNGRQVHVQRTMANVQSIEDNRQVGVQSIDDNRAETAGGGPNVEDAYRHVQHTTLKVAETFLETVRAALMSKLDTSTRETNTQDTAHSLTDSVKTDTSSTLLKQVYRESITRKTTVTRTTSISSTTTTSNNNSLSDDVGESDLYSQRIQVGNENVMLVCEPRETKTRQVKKQVGDNNIMVNINIQIFSNTCQLMDQVGNIIPLDSDGEVWLEIKRRDKNTANDGHNSTASGGTADIGETSRNNTNVPPSTQPVARRSITENSDYSFFDDNQDARHKETGSVTPNSSNELDEKYITTTEAVSCNPVANAFMRHLTNTPSVNINRSNGARSAVEHSFGMWRENTRISETSDTLSLKDDNYNHGYSLMDRRSVDEDHILDAMLTHQKVVDFMLNEGNDFNVSICQWEYEREPIYYSYVANNGRRVVDDEDRDYDAVPFPTATESEQRPALMPCVHRIQRTPKLNRQECVSDEFATAHSNELPATDADTSPAASTKPAIPPRATKHVQAPAASSPSPNTDCSTTVGTSKHGCMAGDTAAGVGVNRGLPPPPIHSRAKPPYPGPKSGQEHAETPATLPLPPARSPRTLDVRRNPHPKIPSPKPPRPDETPHHASSLNSPTSPSLIPSHNPSSQDIAAPPRIPERAKPASATSPITEQSAPGFTRPTPDQQPDHSYAHGGVPRSNVPARRPWYHRDISRDESITRLKSTTQDQPFLVRDSSDNLTSSHKYTMDILHEPDINKLKIIQTSDGGYQFEGIRNEETIPSGEEGKKMVFNSLDELIAAVIEKGIEIDVGDCTTKTISVTPLDKHSFS